MPSIPELAARARSVRRTVSQLPEAQKRNALIAAAAALRGDAQTILDANEMDADAATTAGRSQTVIDRLRLTPTRIDAMAHAIEAVAALPDPIGEETDSWTRPNGLNIRKVRVPLGVVGVIYENRPNVTSDAAALCLKSGNVAFLRGSGSAIRSNTAIAAILRDAYESVGVPADALLLVGNASRDSAVAFMQLRGTIDCLIPRGGSSLIAGVREHATVPYVIDGDGNCHIYVDRSADLDLAESVIVNAKTQRPSVCNAAESLLVDRAIAAGALPRLAAALGNVALVGDDASRAIVPRIEPATDDDFAREFLDLRMSVALVDGVEPAIDWIDRFSSGHSEAIIATDPATIERFTSTVDAAAVVVNASTRFVDGEEFGFGAEIGISTQKLHARGPMGLRQLTCEKYILSGTGQTRH